MAKAKLFFSARGVAVTIPRVVLDELSIEGGSHVDINVRGGAIHLRPCPVTRLNEPKELSSLVAASRADDWEA